MPRANPANMSGKPIWSTRHNQIAFYVKPRSLDFPLPFQLAPFAAGRASLGMTILNKLAVCRPEGLLHPRHNHADVRATAFLVRHVHAGQAFLVLQLAFEGANLVRRFFQKG